MRPSRPLTVLQVVDSLGMGGAETWLLEVLRRWSREEIGRMDFVLTGGVRDLFDDEAADLGAQVHYLPFRRGCLGQFASRFRRVLRDGRYDAIHDHQAYISGWHFLFGYGLLPPVRVVHVHNPAYQMFDNYGVTTGRRWAIGVGKFLTAIYATHIAGTSAQCIRENGFEVPLFNHLNKQTVHCGFDPARFSGDREAARRSMLNEFGWPDEAKVVLVAGRIDQSADPADRQVHKNSAFAVEIAIESIRRDPQVRALFAGALSPAVPALERRVEQAECTGRIRFAGIRRDIARLMLASDVLLFPSRAEGLGMVAVEAQASGLPVLASTAVPRECVVVPELVAFLPVQSGPANWAQTLLHLMARPRPLEAPNRQVADSAFAIEQSARALRSLYQGGLA